MKIKIWGDNFFSQQILPGIYARKAARIITAFREKIETSTVEFVGGNDIDEMLVQIKLDIEKQNERKKDLEDKVKAILFSVSISITAITFSLTYGKRIVGDFFDIISLIFLLASILYFIGSAMVSVNALIPVPFQIIQTETSYDAKENVFSIVKQEKYNYYKELILAKQFNDSSNLKTANYTYASLRLLRNGIILFSIYFISALVQKEIASKLPNTSIISNKIHVGVNDTLSIDLPYSYQNQTDNDNLEIGKPELVMKHSPTKQVKGLKKGTKCSIDTQQIKSAKK